MVRMFRLNWSPMTTPESGSDAGGGGSSGSEDECDSLEGGRGGRRALADDDTFVRIQEAGRRRQMRYRQSRASHDHQHQRQRQQDEDSSDDGRGDGHGHDHDVGRSQLLPPQLPRPTSPQSHDDDDPYSMVKDHNRSKSGSTKATTTTVSSLDSLTESESEWSQSLSASNSHDSQTELSSIVTGTRSARSSLRTSGDEGDVDTSEDEEDEDEEEGRYHSSRHQAHGKGGGGGGGGGGGKRILSRRPAPIRLSGRAYSAPSYVSSPIATTITVTSKLRHRGHQHQQSYLRTPETPPSVDLEDPYIYDASTSASGSGGSGGYAARSRFWRRKPSKADHDSDDDVQRHLQQQFWERSAYEGLHYRDIEQGVGGGGALPHLPSLGYSYSPQQTPHREDDAYRRVGSTCDCLRCSGTHATQQQQQQQIIRTKSWPASGPGSKGGSCLSVGRCFRILRAVLAAGAVTGILGAARAHLWIASSYLGGVVGLAPDSSGAAVAGAGVAASAYNSGRRLTLPDVIPNPVTAVAAELTRMALKTERPSLLERVSRPERLPSNPTSQTGGVGTYSVRLVKSSGTRTDLTESSVEALAACASVADVRVSTSPEDGVPGAGWGRDDVGAAAHVGKPSRAGPTTDAVLLLSDDVALTCDELDRAFAVWSKNPDRMVGFFAYDLLSDATRQRWSLEEVPRGQGTYSLVSDRAAFVHRAYLTSLAARAATEAASPLIGRQQGGAGGEVDYDGSPCRSLALSVAVTSATSKPPVIVAAGPLQLRSLPSVQKNARTISDAPGGEIINAYLEAECLLGLTAAVGVRELPGEERTYVGA